MKNKGFIIILALSIAVSTFFGFTFLGGKITVKVVTGHEMKGYEHYIVKHVLLDSKHKFLDEHSFDPTKDPAAISAFTLQDYSGKLYVLSLCNKHDLWLNEAEV